MAHKELDLRERRTIEDMLNAKISVREIAAEIGRHVSTVYREIKRNHYDDKELPELNGYYGVVAQRAATQRRARRRKLVRLVGLRKAVIKQLKGGWSPEQIAGRLHFEGQTVRVSQETIYAYVYGPDGSPENLHGTCPTVARNGDRIIHAGPVALYSRRIGPSMSGLTTLIPARHLANGRVI